MGWEIVIKSGVLSASLEDYLEAIFQIVAEKPAARVKDIAKKLNVAGPSVTGALQALTERKLINYAPYELITLTPKGKQVAKEIVRSHEVLTRFLSEVLLIKETNAEEVACKMEHAVPKNVLERLVQFVEFVAVCPRAEFNWNKGFGFRCSAGKNIEECEHCMLQCIEDMKKSTSPGEVQLPVTLKKLNPGQKARIHKINVKGPARKRIADMGVNPGSLVEVKRIAPLGDPIEIKIKG